MPEILGVRIDNFSLEEIREKIPVWLNSDEQKKIFTPNPEMLVLAQEFPRFKQTLNEGDLNLCDGFGVTLVSGGKIKRISGSDFVFELCRIGEEQQKNIFLLGTEDIRILTKTKEVLLKKFPRLEIVGLDLGPTIKINEEGGVDVHGIDNEKVIEVIKKSKADILVVAFGQIKQETWIAQFMSKIPNIKIAIGVGGTFNFISGQIKRAPLILRKIGLEWLYRLMKEPRKRFKRIWRATIIFLLYNIKYGGNNRY